jgi:hypothetical protein
MPVFTLQSLGDHTIAIDLCINGREVRLRGTGVLEELAGAGPVLKIHIPDPTGDFDVVLHEGRFQGPILEDKASGCDFRISVQASDLCVPAP